MDRSLAVGAAAARVRTRFEATDPPLTNHMCFSAQPSVVYAFATDADLERAKTNGLTWSIRDATLEVLRELKCPNSTSVGVTFISEEEVDRQGGPMSFFR